MLFFLEIGKSRKNYFIIIILRSSRTINSVWIVGIAKVVDLFPRAQQAF
jgi:hypothetical protein